MIGVVSEWGRIRWVWVITNCLLFLEFILIFWLIFPSCPSPLSSSHTPGPSSPSLPSNPPIPSATALFYNSSSTTSPLSPLNSFDKPISMTPFLWLLHYTQWFSFSTVISPFHVWPKFPWCVFSGFNTTSSTPQTLNFPTHISVVSYSSHFLSPSSPYP